MVHNFLFMLHENVFIVHNFLFIPIISVSETDNFPLFRELPFSRGVKFTGHCFNIFMLQRYKMIFNRKYFIFATFGKQIN